MVSLSIDVIKARALAQTLPTQFKKTGILGNMAMPEDELPRDVVQGSLEHLLFITLTVSIDYQRDATALWRTARAAMGDPDTCYLFDPRRLQETPPKIIKENMARAGISKKQAKDSWIWRTVGVTFCKKWAGDPRNFLEDCEWDAPVILERLQKDSHMYNGKLISDFPYLRGPKISSLWIRMLRDNVGIENLRNLDQIPIPVDVHVARATLATGVVRGQATGSVQEVFKYVRQAWFEGVKGLTTGDRPMIALDVDEALWHLSKSGCTQRDKATGACPVASHCEVKEFCVPGNVYVSGNSIEVNT